MTIHFEGQETNYMNVNTLGIVFAICSFSLSPRQVFLFLFLFSRPESSLEDAAENKINRREQQFSSFSELSLKSRRRTLVRITKIPRYKRNEEIQWFLNKRKNSSVNFVSRLLVSCLQAIWQISDDGKMERWNYFVLWFLVLLHV